MVFSFLKKFIQKEKRGISDLSEIERKILIGGISFIIGIVIAALFITHL